MSSTVPEGWSFTDFGQISSNRKTKFQPEIDSERFVYLGLEHLGVASRKIREFGKSVDVRSTKTKFYKGDTLFGKLRPYLRKVAYPDFDGICSTDILALSPRKNTDSEFLFYICSSDEFIANAVESSAGNIMPRASWGDLVGFPILLPPLPEQKKIASILTSVDKVIENTQKQIDKLQDLKKATMNELLTKGIGHKEFKDSELGRIPKSWGVSLIGEICKVGTGKRDTQNKTKYGKYPFFVRSQTIERIDSYAFDGEAILTAGDGVGTGKVFHYVNGRFDFHQRVYKLSDFRGGALGKFLYYCFSSRFLKQVQQFSARGSVESVRMEMITGMAIPLPSIQEQSKIVDCIAAIETNISLGKQKLSQTQSLKKSLMQDFLTGKVRVTVN